MQLVGFNENSDVIVVPATFPELLGGIPFTLSVSILKLMFLSPEQVVFAGPPLAQYGPQKSAPTPLRLLGPLIRRHGRWLQPLVCPGYQSSILLLLKGSRQELETRFSADQTRPLSLGLPILIYQQKRQWPKGSRCKEIAARRRCAWTFGR